LAYVVGKVATLARKRVLIVDDNDDFRVLLRRHLEDHGYNVVGEARNGPEGVSMAFKLNPDFLTLDYQMPYLTGKEALEHIQEIRPNTKVIVVSATLPEAPEWADHFVPKTDFTRLAALIEEIDGKEDQS
jgi:two-component system, chemotaxis family, chemotaxis protein CheY